MLNQTAPVKPVYALPRMGAVCLAMIKDMLDAYVERDADKAFAVWLRDEELDEMYTSLFRELLTYMIEDARNITACTHLLFMAKNLGTHRRPHHEHRGDAVLPRAWQGASADPPRNTIAPWRRQPWMTTATRRAQPDATPRPRR